MKLIFHNDFWKQLSSMGNYKNKFLDCVVWQVRTQYKIYISRTKKGFFLPANCSLCKSDFDDIFKSIITDMINQNGNVESTLLLAELGYPYFDIIK